MKLMMQKYKHIFFLGRGDNLNGISIWDLSEFKTVCLIKGDFAVNVCTIYL